MSSEKKLVGVARLQVDGQWVEVKLYSETNHDSRTFITGEAEGFEVVGILDVKQRPRRLQHPVPTAPAVLGLYDNARGCE